jgi:hypothetical protein
MLKILHAHFFSSSRFAIIVFPPFTGMPDEIDLQRRLGMVPEIKKKNDADPIPNKVMEAIQNYVKATHSRDEPDQRDIGIVRQCENQEGITFQTKQKRVHLDRSHGPLTETTRRS